MKIMETLKLNKIIGLVFLIMICSFNSYSHPGGTDSRGGHHDRKRGGYHFHHGNRPHQHPNGACELIRKVEPQPWYQGWLVLLTIVGGIGGFYWFYKRINNTGNDLTKYPLLDKILFITMGWVGVLFTIGLYGVCIWGFIAMIIHLFK